MRALLVGDDHATGLGDLTVALKYRVLDAMDGAPALGILPFVTLPVAEALIGPEHPDFGVVLLADFELLWEPALTVNPALAGLGAWCGRSPVTSPSTLPSPEPA